MKYFLPIVVAMPMEYPTAFRVFAISIVMRSSKNYGRILKCYYILRF